jgi:hypothetical protein
VEAVGRKRLARAPIDKAGHGYLRTLLIQGAKSAVLTAHKLAQTPRPDQPLGPRAARALGLADRCGGAGQQERAHPVGGDDQGRSLRPQPHQRQAWCAVSGGYRLTDSIFLAQTFMTKML